MKYERGSLTVEMVILAPILMFMVLFGVHVGRLSEAKVQVQHAADQGARAGSLAAKSKVVSAAKAAAESDLKLAGVSCTEVSVDVGLVTTGLTNAVRVQVDCDVRIDGTELLGLLPDRVHASSIEVIDEWRIP
jgi:Flp pilus assembly protein TadG